MLHDVVVVWARFVQQCSVRGMSTRWIFNLQHAATRSNRMAKRVQDVAPNNVARCFVEMLRSLGRSVLILGPTMYHRSFGRGLMYVRTHCVGSKHNKRQLQIIFVMSERVAGFSYRVRVCFNKVSLKQRWRISIFRQYQWIFCAVQILNTCSCQKWNHDCFCKPQENRSLAYDTLQYQVVDIFTQTRQFRLKRNTILNFIISKENI